MALEAKLRLSCELCGVALDAASCEQHRAWCPSHRFVCPCAGCNSMLLARELAAHVKGHADTHRLERRADGSYHLVVGAVRAGGDTVVMLVGDAVVMLTTVPHRRAVPNYVTGLEWGLLTVQLHAYYASGEAAPIVATVRQLRVGDCDTPGAWIEEHRMGVVSPMIASRESIVVSHAGPVFAPRSTLSNEHVGAIANERAFLCANVTPGEQLMRTVRASAVRDLPLDRSMLTQVEPCSSVAILHVVLRHDATQCIGEAYRV